jgi:hypothetical protein
MFRCARVLGACFFLAGANARGYGATPLNFQAALGINVVSMNYYNPEQPFLDVFKTEATSNATPDGWLTHSNASWDTKEEQYLQLDANGYPTTLTTSSADPHSPQQFNSVGVLLLRGLANSNAGRGLPYRPGKYVVLYDGQGTLGYQGDARLVSSAPGRDVINVAAPHTGGGIDLRITSTDPRHTGNYIRNIRVVKAEEESLLSAGYVFRPGFLRLMQGFRVIRLMQWLGIDDAGGATVRWSGRPLPTDAGWGSGHGVPIEIGVQLCNALGADCWLNVPHAADDDYINQMAVLVHKTLALKERAYIEFSNEVWNSGYAQYSYAIAQGQALWPNAGASPFDYNRSWFGMRTARMCDIWKSAWGSDASRVVCVLGAQAANTYTATQSLNCPLWSGAGNAPCSNHNINAVAIAPYFGGSVPAAWTSEPDGGLSKLFASMSSQNDSNIPERGWLGQISGFEVAYQAALARYKLPFIGYEGGQTFTGFPHFQDGSAMVNLFIAANRDPRMATAYTAALDAWKRNGGQLWVLFADVSAPSQYGEWGLVESFMDSLYPLSNAPPKWRAVQSFDSKTTCWWSACVGQSGELATPMPPAHVPAAQ